MKSITLGTGNDKFRYQVVEYPLDGSIDSPGSGKMLHIGRKRGTRVHMETAAHECIHGACPSMTEATVDRLAHSITRLLWGLGYRCD